MREAVRLYQQNAQEKQLNIEALPLLKNPRIFAEMIKSNQQRLTPLWLELIEEEIVDKLLFLKEMLEKMGVPIIDDELTELVKVRLSQISK